jgi:hypothetical protein
MEAVVKCIQLKRSSLAAHILDAAWTRRTGEAQIKVDLLMAARYKTRTVSVIQLF